VLAGAGAGVAIKLARLMHLNNDYVFDGKEYDVSNLIVTTYVKAKDSVREGEISDRLKEQFRILNRNKPPDIKAGRHCTDPVLCEFYDLCNPGTPAGHVSRLPRIGPKRLERLISAGITSIKRIPADFPLTKRQRRATDSVKSGKPFISPGPEHAWLAGKRYRSC